jgi:hypothetical protein
MGEFVRALGPAVSQLEEAVTEDALRVPPMSQTIPLTTLAGSATGFERQLSQLRPRRRVGVVIGGTAALVALGAVLAVRQGLFKMPSSSPAPVTTPPVVAEPVAPIAVPPAPLVKVRIGSRPGDALVVRERDGHELGPTPFEDSWPQGTGVEKVRLERAGYRPEHLEVPLDRPSNLTVELKKEREAVASPPPRPHHARPRPVHTPPRPEPPPKEAPKEAPKAQPKEPVPI